MGKTIDSHVRGNLGDMERDLCAGETIACYKTIRPQASVNRVAEAWLSGGHGKDTSQDLLGISQLAGPASDVFSGRLSSSGALSDM